MPAPKAQKSPACLLVVEDEVLIRMLLADELRAEGFSVIEAATANEALSYFQAIPHDAVLYKQRHKIETCSGASKTGGASTPDTTVAPITYFSAICIAAAVAFWL